MRSKTYAEEIRRSFENRSGRDCTIFAARLLPHQHARHRPARRRQRGDPLSLLRAQGRRVLGRFVVVFRRIEAANHRSAGVLQERGAGGFPPQDDDLLMDTATFSPELVRLVAIALLEVRGKAEEVCRSHMSPLFTSITNYLQENVETGSIRNLNPAIGTLGIALTVFAQPELSKLVEGCRLSSMNRREALETYSQFWLGALLPTAEKHLQETFEPSEAVSA